MSRRRLEASWQGLGFPMLVRLLSSRLSDPTVSATAVGYMGPFQLKKGQEIEFTPVAKRKRMSYMK
jgi:hypothetical protein